MTVKELIELLKYEDSDSVIAIGPDFHDVDDLVIYKKEGVVQLTLKEGKKKK